MQTVQKVGIKEETLTKEIRDFLHFFKKKVCTALLISSLVIDAHRFAEDNEQQQKETVLVFKYLLYFLVSYFL